MDITKELNKQINSDIKQLQDEVVKLWNITIMHRELIEQMKGAFNDLVNQLNAINTNSSDSAHEPNNLQSGENAEGDKQEAGDPSIQSSS